MSQAEVRAAIDIGGTKALGVLLAEDGTVLAEQRMRKDAAEIDALYSDTP